MGNLTLHTLKNKVKRLPHVSSRPMFGYECYSARGKFFVVFSRKDDSGIIIRLSKDVQQEAIGNKGIKPFSHVAKAGWIEIDIKSVRTADAFEWVKKGYRYALGLSKQSKK